MIGGRWAGLSVVAMLVGPRPAGAVSICALDRAVSPDGEHRAGEALGFAARVAGGALGVAMLGSASSPRP